MKMRSVWTIQLPQLCGRNSHDRSAVTALSCVFSY